MKKGDKVRILRVSHGYKKGDIGVIVEDRDNDNYVQVFVEGRESLSDYAPNVAFCISNLELISITEEIEQLEKRLAELKAMQENKRFVPREGEEYYYLSPTLEVSRNANNKHSFDNTLIHTHNCFRTKREAEKRAKTISKKYDIINRIEELNEGWVLDWDDEEQGKWSIEVHKGKYITWVAWEIKRQPDALHFKSKEIGEQLIKEFGDDLGCIFEL